MDTQATNLVAERRARRCSTKGRIRTPPRDGGYVDLSDCRQQSQPGSYVDVSNSVTGGFSATEPSADDGTIYAGALGDRQNKFDSGRCDSR